MATAIVLPKDYNLVLATAALTTTVSFFHVWLTWRRRNAAGVPYPNAYASAEEASKSEAKFAFNAAQRAHANFTEHWLHFLIGLTISGLKYPRAAAATGTVWIVGRFVYAWGYSRVGRQYSENGKGRKVGTWHIYPQLGLMGMSLYTVAQMVM